jgi:hypothetical protein
LKIGLQFGRTYIKENTPLSIKIFWTIISYHPWTLAMFLKTFPCNFFFYPSSSWIPLELVKVAESYVKKSQGANLKEVSM